MAYKFKVDCASGCLAGLEALDCCQDPVHDTIGSGRFIDLANVVGLIDALTLQVWTRLGAGSCRGVPLALGGQRGGGRRSNELPACGRPPTRPRGIPMTDRCQLLTEKHGWCAFQVDAGLAADSRKSALNLATKKKRGRQNIVPAFFMLVPETGFELVTFALRMRCSTN